MDIEGYRPTPGEKDITGAIIPVQHYNQKDFDANLVIDERTKRVARWVSDFLKRSGDRLQKTIIFCVDTDHASRLRHPPRGGFAWPEARLRAAIANENADLGKQNLKYVMRITGDDSEGVDQLSNFIDPEFPPDLQGHRARPGSGLDDGVQADRRARHARARGLTAAAPSLRRPIRFGAGLKQSRGWRRLSGGLRDAGLGMTRCGALDHPWQDMTSAFILDQSLQPEGLRPEPRDRRADRLRFNRPGPRLRRLASGREAASLRVQGYPESDHVKG